LLLENIKSLGYLEQCHNHVIDKVAFISLDFVGGGQLTAEPYKTLDFILCFPDLLDKLICVRLRWINFGNINLKYIHKDVPLQHDSGNCLCT
jgi:hypothetical protein